MTRCCCLLVRLNAVFIALGCLLWGDAASAQIMVSANEGKYDLSSGVGRVIDSATAEADSLTILDFGQFPPRVRNIPGVANSVVGPPTNVAITPDERLVLVANSVRRYTDDPKKPVPDDVVQVVDLNGGNGKIVSRVTVGKQPSGIAIRRSGDLAMVANRADGTISVLAIDGPQVTVRETITVGDAASEPSDVAINPAGDLALVSLNKGAAARVLRIVDGHVKVDERKIPLYGEPYHAQITPDGALALVAGAGNQKGLDADLLTLVDLRARQIHTIDHVKVGTGPESFDISPDGRLVAVVLMEGSNVPADDPQRAEHAWLRLFKLDGQSLARVQELRIGRIPEGVCFSPDGKYLVVQEHAAKRLVLFAVKGGALEETGVHIPTPGFPSALRRAEPRR
ncbi:MAG TPA: YncE family protein [Pirellulales bacterium]|jgi:DNA-binding beta-propeller fold protein YncE